MTTEQRASPLDVVRDFVTRVRSGVDPQAAHRLMAPTVRAHQVASSSPRVLERTPANYVEHVAEFKRDFGDYKFEIEELMASEDKVYVRWRQTGTHLAPIMGFEATRKELVFVGSAVYRVHHGCICEYWIQQEWLGLLKQLERNAQADH